MNNEYNPIIISNEERWLPITGRSVPNIKENAYAVSDRGRVYSYLSNSYLTPVKTWNGYFRVALQRNDKTTRYFLIHRIVMIEFCFIYNYDIMQVNHYDGDKFNNYLWNLEWNTASENIKHAFDHGLKVQPKGEDTVQSTITNEQADQIGAML